jgi:hypothetical protein
MPNLVAMNGFDTLFLLAFLINGGYLLFRDQFGSPIKRYIKIERAVRARFIKISKIEDENVERLRKRVAIGGRHSERELKVIVGVMLLFLYAATLAAFALLAGAALYDWLVTPDTGILIIAGLFAPVPLTIFTVSLAVRLYTGRISGGLSRMAVLLGADDRVKEETAGQSVKKSVGTTLDIIESAIGSGGGRSSAP